MVVLQAYRFCLDPTPAQARRLTSHAGAARFAFNFGLGLVKDRLSRRSRGEEVDVPWTLPALRREWNRAKHQLAPWWPENSKEAASSGLADLAAALKAFSDSKRGVREGPRVGFPRFRRRGTGRDSFRYTTGRFGVSGRTRVQLPRIGHVRTHEPTLKLASKLDSGNAKILSATVSRDSTRWFCSFCCQVNRNAAVPRTRECVGVDVGVRHLAVLSSGERIENPRGFEGSRRRLRRLQRQLDRQRRSNNPACYDDQRRAVKGSRPVVQSNRQRKTELRIARLQRGVRNARLDAIHKLTSRLASQYEVVVVERLNVRGLCRSGTRGLRRAIHDSALGMIRRQLHYKTAWGGGTLIEAPMVYPSSKRCSGCGATKAKLPLSERMYRCEQCGLILDRDENAARNLATLSKRVAASGAETENARSPTQIRPDPSGAGLTAKPAVPCAAFQTGAASEQSKAA